MNYLEKVLQERRAQAAAKSWDTAAHMAPDPAWSAEKQLAWYAAATLPLALNSSERCRRDAAAEGDRRASRCDR